MEIASGGRRDVIMPAQEHPVFVPGHAWNKPDWSGHVGVLTFFFGANQLGASLVRHRAALRYESQRAERL